MYTKFLHHIGTLLILGSLLLAAASCKHPLQAARDAITWAHFRSKFDQFFHCLHNNDKNSTQSSQNLRKSRKNSKNNFLLPHCNEDLIFKIHRFYQLRPANSILSYCIVSAYFNLKAKYSSEITHDSNHFKCLAVSPTIKKKIVWQVPHIFGRFPSTLAGSSLYQNMIVSGRFISNLNLAGFPSILSSFSQLCQVPL